MKPKPPGVLLVAGIWKPPYLLLRTKEGKEWLSNTDDVTKRAFRDAIQRKGEKLFDDVYDPTVFGNLSSFLLTPIVEYVADLFGLVYQYATPTIAGYVAADAFICLLRFVGYSTDDAMAIARSEIMSRLHQSNTIAQRKEVLTDIATSRFFAGTLAPGDQAVFRNVISYKDQHDGDLNVLLRIPINL